MSKKVRFKIDEKSLFRGEYNDYAHGQTATVSTPINQNSDPTKWHNDILELRETNSKVDGKIPDMLVRQCLKNSKADCELVDLFVFDNITLDGKKLEVDCQFAMYIKKETEKLKRHKGKLQNNIHFGRLKLHYPISLLYKTDGFKIDNSKVLDEIIRQNGGFAFVVRGFEYFEDTKTLNFITSLIGPEGIRLTTVFRRQKGVGKKLVIDPDKVSDQEYVCATEEDYETEGLTTTFDLINKSRVENGKLGEEKVYQLLLEKLAPENELYHTSLDYPKSPYDMEYLENGVKKYVEVKSTSGNKPIFNMSSGEIKFMEKYKDDYTLYMVMNVKEKFPKIVEYKYKDIMKMRKEYPKVVFYA